LVRNDRHFTCTKSATSLCNWNLLQCHLRSVPTLSSLTVAFKMGCYKYSAISTIANAVIQGAG
jgi:hypothetical protein